MCGLVVRTPSGFTAVGFASERRQNATFHPGQAWIRLAEPVLRPPTAPLGITIVTIHPQFTTHADHVGRT